MSEQVEKLGILVGLFELAIGRLFETVPGDDEAKRRFVADVRHLLASTNALQPHLPAAQTYEALLRRSGATSPEEAAGLGVAPTPEHGLPVSGPGVSFWATRHSHRGGTVERDVPRCRGTLPVFCSERIVR